MAKVNVYSLPRPARPREVCVLAKDGEPITLTLQAADQSIKLKSLEAAEILIKLHVTGDPDLGRDPAPFLHTETQPSRLLITSACLLAGMQDPEDPADAYDPYELIHLSAVRPRDWLELNAVAGRLQHAWEGDRPNSPGAPTA